VDTKNAALDEQLLALKNAQERVAGGLQYHGYAVDPKRTPVHLLEATAALVPGLQLLAGLDHPMTPCVSASLIHTGNPAAVVSAIDALGAAVCHDAVASNCVVAGAGVERARVGEEAEFTVELRDKENAALQDLPTEAALAMVAVKAVAQVAAADGSGGGGGSGDGTAAVIAVPVSTTCAGGGSLVTCKYTVPPDTGSGKRVTLDIGVHVLGQPAQGSPYKLTLHYSTFNVPEAPQLAELWAQQSDTPACSYHIPHVVRTKHPQVTSHVGFERVEWTGSAVRLHLPYVCIKTVWYRVHGGGGNHNGRQALDHLAYALGAQAGSLSTASGKHYGDQAQAALPMMYYKGSCGSIASPELHLTYKQPGIHNNDLAWIDVIF
jgi:hypothetical protein